VSDQNGTPNTGGLDEGALPIRLLHDRVLVSTDNEPGERRSSAGIVIPATVAIGRRLAWGPSGCRGNQCQDSQAN
jgi:chaperonin GroES